MNKYSTISTAFGLVWDKGLNRTEQLVRYGFFVTAKKDRTKPCQNYYNYCMSWALILKNHNKRLIIFNLVRSFYRRASAGQWWWRRGCTGSGIQYPSTSQVRQHIQATPPKQSTLSLPSHSKVAREELFIIGAQITRWCSLPAHLSAKGLLQLLATALKNYCDVTVS